MIYDCLVTFFTIKNKSHYNSITYVSICQTLVLTLFFSPRHKKRIILFVLRSVFIIFAQKSEDKMHLGIKKE